MEENKIKILIQLLEDPDTEVYEAVYQEILKLGKNYYPLLESEFKSSQNELVKTRLMLILQQFQGELVTDKLLNWRKGGGESLLEGWSLVTQYFYPTFNFLDYKKKISNWVHKIWLKTRPNMKIEQKIRTVISFLEKQDFYFKRTDDLYTNPELMFLNTVVDQKKGNYLSICLLLNIIFHQLEIYTHVVSVEGRFFVRYLDYKEHYYVNPIIYSKDIFYEEDLKVFLIMEKKELNLLHYKPISNIYLILHLLDLLKSLYKEHQNHEQYKKAQALLEYIDIKFI
ncbi:MAG: hypothetical protein KatS3mg035_0365 [Bacteroidia bacterium]|nr:MAG: hypothetical protein KatS3mg035_0365 [Bacteroidia bacterium]